SSTSTRAAWPATRGATNVTWPFTNASSVDTVVSARISQGTTSIKTTTARTPPAIASHRLRWLARGALAGRAASRPAPGTTPRGPAFAGGGGATGSALTLPDSASAI